ncbi:4,5-DOPA dioxygenase extradiol [Lampropedia puyangensis]|uniref:4,5-DOPA dioxygenase extradiol n=2 Tax=Lampropedia puyangensis TaxID=1330072 RepID=A0A4S8F5B3_9BURK|nr:4,5-DOPA dioxygenase extradiol [Lampropedia puyangensis]
MALGSQWVQPVSAAGLDKTFASLQPSARQPVLFMGHGSPMNVLPGNPWRSEWEKLGRALMQQAETPQLILCVSAHWLTRGGWFVTGMDKPRTIHDFGGFPKALYDMQYPAPGAPNFAKNLARSIHVPAPEVPDVGVDHSEWGLDHGTWSVLLPMFPEARIPVVQLSMDYARPLNEHYQIGLQLRALRERGVLIVGSGNIVHNLRLTQRDAAANQAYDWAIEFDRHVHALVDKGDLAALQNVQQLGSVMQQAHPTHDHYLPLLYAAAAVHEGEKPMVFNEGFQAASISMQSIVWGLSR